MSLSKSTLSAIQQAGEALHRATVVVSGAVREQAEHMVSTVAAQPFEAEGEQAIANFKQLARLSQDLQSLEERLRVLYANASELASPAMDVVNALPHASTRHITSYAKDAAEDAVVKPASSRATRAVPKPAKARSAGGKRSGQGSALTPNDQALLQFLQKALDTRSWTRLTGVAMAQGSGLPLGSVGISLKRLMATGHVTQGARGTFKRRA